MQVWQALYLTATIGWTYHRHWSWSHTVFIVLHSIVMMMKQHSYAFYNGYCKSNVERMRAMSLREEVTHHIYSIRSLPAN